MHDSHTYIRRVLAGKRILPQAGDAAMRWIERSTFEELVISNADERMDRAVEETTRLLEMIRPYVPDADLFYRVTHDKAACKNYYEDVGAGFRRNGILFIVGKNTYPKTFYMLHCDLSGFCNVDSFSRDEAADGLTKPDNIGVFSRRKIEDWVEYWTQYYCNLERINAENRRKVETFRRRLEALPDVVWNRDGNQGCIERNGLKYDFTIYCSGYYENLTLDFRRCSLDDFLALSDNRFSSREK